MGASRARNDAGVFTMAEIAMLLPHSGGTFVYLHRIYGKIVGYAYGWGSFACIQSASTAAIAYVFAESLNAVFTLPKIGTRMGSVLRARDLHPLC